MFTKLIIDGVLYIAQVMRYEHRRARVARIYDPRATTPDRVLDEVQTGIFLDREYDRKYKLTPTGLVTI